jgi:AcrR family transcriptional regulator
VTTRPRRYDSPLRREQAERTKEAILEAFAEQLGRPGAAELSVKEASLRAGVAVRTVYHYFPDRQAQLKALAAWIEARLVPVPFQPRTPDDLVELGRRLYASFREAESLGRAQMATGFASEVRALRRERRVRMIREIVGSIDAPPAMVERAAVVIAHLASAEAGIPLTDRYGLTYEEATAAALQAIQAIIADLRSHACGTSAAETP